jgi:MFS transporter, AAHS family, 4-hydroxybenzoate transporter
MGAILVRATDPDRTTLLVSSLCFLVLLLEGYDVSAMGYAMPSLIEEWHASAAQFTTAVTCAALSMLLGSLLAGALGDRIGRKPTMIGCVATFGAFSTVTALSTGLGSLTLLRALTCLGLGGGVPLSIALATDYASTRRPYRLVILMSSGLAVGSTMGGFSARQFVASLGWQAIFIVGGLLPMLLIPLLVAFLPEGRAFRAEPISKSPVGLLQLFDHGLATHTIALWVANFCNMTCAFLILAWLPALLQRQGLPVSDAIVASTMYAFGSIFGVAIIAPIADRFGAERVVACILGLGAVCMALAGSVALPYAQLCLVIGGIGIGIGGGQHGINSITGALYSATFRATGAGWALGIGRIGQILGPLAGGLLLGFSWQPRNILLAAAGPAFGVALATIVLAYVRERERHDRAAMVSQQIC